MRDEWRKSIRALHSRPRYPGLRQKLERIDILVFVCKKELSLQTVKFSQPVVTKKPQPSAGFNDVSKFDGGFSEYKHIMLGS